MHTYTTVPTPTARVKRYTKTVTRTFNDEESLIEERVEEETEYEYVPGQQLYNGGTISTGAPQVWNTIK